MGPALYNRFFDLRTPSDPKHFFLPPFLGKLACDLDRPRQVLLQYSTDERRYRVERSEHSNVATTTHGGKEALPHNFSGPREDPIFFGKLSHDAQQSHKSPPLVPVLLSLSAPPLPSREHVLAFDLRPLRARRKPRNKRITPTIIAACPDQRRGTRRASL